MFCIFKFQQGPQWVNQSVGFVSHHVDIFQIDSCIYILLFKKKEEKVIIGGLIGYSYLYYTILQYYTALSPFSILYLTV